MAGQERYGARREKAGAWGAAHEARHDHQVLGDTRLFSWIVNIRHPTSGGDYHAEPGRATPGTMPDPFLNHQCRGLPGCLRFRRSRQFGFRDRHGASRAIRSPRHYDDLGELWRRGEYIPMQRSESRPCPCGPNIGRNHHAGTPREVTAQTLARSWPRALQGPDQPFAKGWKKPCKAF